VKWKAQRTFGVAVGNCRPTVSVKSDDHKVGDLVRTGRGPSVLRDRLYVVIHIEDGHACCVRVNK